MGQCPEAVTGRLPRRRGESAGGMIVREILRTQWPCMRCALGQRASPRCVFGSYAVCVGTLSGVASPDALAGKAWRARGTALT